MVGYLTATRDGLIGDRGVFYNYILAANGLFLEAQNPLITANICIAPVKVRGLMPLEDKIEIFHGKISKRLYDLALSVLYARPDVEQYLAVSWENGSYHLSKPVQEGRDGHVRYENASFTIMDIHSHGAMPPFFSYVDNKDEQGMRFYMVVGHLNTLAPEHLIRLGVYGYYREMSFEEVFA